MPAVVPVFVSATGSVVVVVLALRSRDLLAFPGLDRDREAPVAAPAAGVPILCELPQLSTISLGLTILPKRALVARAANDALT